MRARLVLIGTLTVACAPEGDPGETAGDLARVVGTGSAAWTAQGDQPGANFGRAVASAGDVDGDGLDDLIVGAPGYDGVGAAFLFRGSPAGLEAVPAWSARGMAADANFGGSVASAGDVDGDGYDDVVVASLANGSQLGSVDLFLGSAGGLAAAPARTLAPTIRGFGASIAGLGDVNGDGFDDVAVGATGFSGASTSTGAAMIFLGSALGLGPAPAWVLQGDAPFAELGSALSAGDLDGDAAPDLVVSSGTYPSARPGTGGAVFVYLGTGAGFAAAPDLALTGHDLGVSLVDAFVVGDPDGDGFDDLVVDTLDGAGFGRSRLFRGSPTGPEPDPSWTADGPVSVRPRGAGDLDADGYDDLAWGDDGWVDGGQRVGGVEIYLGAPTGLQAAPVVVVVGDQARAAFGVPTGAGDVNGDGFADLVVGAPDHDDPDAQEGAAWLFLGRPTSDGDGDHAADAQDLCPTVPDPEQLDGDGDGRGNACDDPWLLVDGLVVPGGPMTLRAAGAAPGETVAFGAVVGAPGAGPCPASLGGLCLDLGAGALDLGAALAGDDGVAVLVATAPANVAVGGPLTVQVSVARGSAGAASVKSEPLVVDGAVLDHDADGLTDAVETALGTDASDPDTDTDGLADGEDLGPFFDPLTPDSDGDGRFDGVDACPEGDDGLDPDGDLVATACDACPDVVDPAQLDGDRDGLGDACEGVVLVGPVWTVEADHASDGLGGAVASAGDVNGDGFADVVVGAPGASYGQAREGRAALHLGGPGGLAPGAIWSREGGAANAMLGTSVAGVGDVNGDGFDDVLVGAPNRSHPQQLEGRVELFEGHVGGLRSLPSWSAEGDASLVELGLALAGAGDVDGDGFDDLLVGSASGTAHLYLGSASGPSAKPDWTSPPAGGSSGSAVAGAGDVNGDGFDDVLVGDTESPNAALFLGSPAGLAGSADWITTSGGVVAGVGDVDGDGLDDVVVSNVPAATVSLFRGRPTGLAAQPSSVVRGERVDGFGTSVAGAGDVNGDGFDDVLVGAPFGPSGAPGGPEQGGARLLLGSRHGMAPAPAWEVVSGLPWANLGFAVASAGDVDADGLSDVVLGAPGVSHLQADEGAVVLFLGRRP